MNVPSSGRARLVCLSVLIVHYVHASDRELLVWLPTLYTDITRSIIHDSEMYPEPEEFRPDKFLKHGGPNPDVRDPRTAYLWLWTQVRVSVQSHEKLFAHLCPP